MQKNTRFELGIYLLILVCVAHIIAYVAAQTEHVFDPSWPAHARFHTLQALFWIIGLNATLLALILAPLRSGRHWPVPALLIGGITTHGAYFASIALLPAGRPPELATHVFLGVLMAGYFFGLWLVCKGRPAINKQSGG